MTSYLRSWLPSLPSASPKSDTPEITRSSPPPQLQIEEDDGGSETEKEDNDDSPPAFPSLSSAQRVKSDNPRTHSSLTDSELMPPPLNPSLAVRTPGMPSISSSSLSASSSLAVPPTTTKPPVKPTKGRGKVALAPGHSPLDWAALKSSGADLRGVDTLMRIPPSVLKQHNKRDDAWSAFNGKVYNITPYLAFHPGGVRKNSCVSLDVMGQSYLP
ncbi:hypothetical protein VNI00_013255 [Paramarasmius palmivorus]|uniref:Cytochrome b5 heme-binding domain-containing protein n=1 Tax=Paramarasmius palmivorus TaxID=297713 RepID=A0AAW0BZI9_9AGAR